jgi:phosphoglycolate phosphatase
MKKLRYQCLVLDHDDTVVDSTAHVHYPAFVEAMALLRPEVSLTLEEYFSMNCYPGFSAYCEDVLHLTAEESLFEQKHWLDYVASHMPMTYPGIKDLICKQKEMGGYVCVVSHSMRDNILRDYAANQLPEPDLVYGKELPPDQRKPSPYPIQEIMRHMGLSPSELLIVDDLKLGYEMAKASHVNFAAACWAHSIPEMQTFMKENCDKCFSSPADLADFLFR